MHRTKSIKINIKGLLLVGSLFLVIVLCSISDMRLGKQNQSKDFPDLWEVALSDKEIPEGLVDIEVDTVMSNDFRVNIHKQTNSERIKHIENNVNSVVKNIYKGFESDLKVYYKKQLVFNHNINKNFFNQQDDLPFWDKAILQTVEVDELKSIDEPLISIRFFNPVLDAFKAYEISIDSDGVYTVQFIEGTHVS